MEKRDECWVVDVLVLEESTCRRLMMKRESKIRGRLKDVRIKTWLNDKNIHVEQWHCDIDNY